MTDGQDGVVLLHGISRTSRSFQKMQAALEAAGFATLNVGYASRSKPIEALAEDIHPAVERFAESLDGSVPKPHDGKVSVENTKLDGMADHIVMETSHPWLVRNGPAIEQTIVFLRDGEFRRS
jgi:hypothetical protein